MATLAVRPIAARDLPAMRHVRQRVAVLDWDTERETTGVSVARHALETLVPGGRREQTFVALIDDELCALLTLRPQLIPYRWDVVILAAGSPRLDTVDDVVHELWMALLEYGVVASGSAGARRLFASADEDSVACRSLRSAGFEPYTRQTLLIAKGVDAASEPPYGMRRQESSDVWSVHHLYHQVTPRPVQFAEAQTSAAWECPKRAIRDWLSPDHRQVAQYVLESIGGIVAYCRVSIGRHRARVDLLADESVRGDAAAFVAAALSESGAARSDVEIIIPQYASDLIWKLEPIGFEPVADRVALVRHTTAPAVVHGRFAVAPVKGERVPKGVPSYYRMRAGSRPAAGVAEPHAAHRMER